MTSIINSSDNGPTSRSKINSNFDELVTEDAQKVEFSWAVPADGDLAVFSWVTGKVIKKKVFGASQVLESDASWQPVSAAKQTAYNKAYGTSAGTTLEGSNDALYMKLAGSQTVTGDKAFTGASTAVTRSPWDNSTKLATTAYVDAAIASFNSGVSTKNLADASGTQVIAHWLGRVPKKVNIKIASPITYGTSSFVAFSTYNWTTQSSLWFAGDWTNFWYTTAAFQIWDSSSARYQTWVITFDATNITITWTKTSSPTGIFSLMWEAQ